jgi:hypothetical protein
MAVAPRRAVAYFSRGWSRLVSRQNAFTELAAVSIQLPFG